MKKKTIIIIAICLAIIIGSVIWGIVSLKPVSKRSDQVTFIIEKNTNKIQIVENLKKAGLIKSKYATLAYVFFFTKNLQAGTYIIDRKDSAIEIMQQIGRGDTKEKPPIVEITFVEGKRFVDYAKLISNNFDITYDEIIELGEDEEFLKELINKYWFIDESILNQEIYYPLEGYLAPNTYQFYQTADIKTIIYKLLDQTQMQLEEIKTKIEESEYTFHELLTMSSIIEKEALNKEDREKVSQVIYTRLNMNMTLGMDVTSYYGVFKDMTEDITIQDLNANNPYNTRNKSFFGLPVGPICNASLESIKASLNPSDTDYIYFFADIKTGKVYFAKTYEEFKNIESRFEN